MQRVITGKYFIVQYIVSYRDIHAYVYYKCSDTLNILKAIKNATGTSVIFPINISLIHFVYVLTSVPNVRERFTKI